MSEELKRRIEEAKKEEAEGLDNERFLAIQKRE